jgi:hypothetical protein
MQGCVQNGGTKIIQKKHFYSHEVVSLFHHQVMKEEGEKERKERSHNVKFTIIKILSLDEI